MQLHQLVPILQMAVSPVILISGIGLVLLSITNRFGRVIDRARVLSDVLRNATPERHARLDSQLQILYRRSRVMRLSVALCSVALLLAALLIIVLFTSAFLQLELGTLIAFSFIACMISLIGSLVAFIADINLSLAALKLQIEVTEPNVLS